MKKHLGLFFAFTVLFSTLFSLPGFAAVKVPESTYEFYVADYAGVLDDTTKNGIIAANIELYEKTGAQIVVATVDFLDNAGIEDYCYSMFEQWEIGSKKTNNGILLLLAIGEDNYYCMTGYGIENELPGGTIKKMTDEYLEPDFAVQQYDAGVRKMFKALIHIYEDSYGVTISGTATVPKDAYYTGGGGSYYDPNTGAPKGHQSGGSSILGTFVTMLVVFILISSFTSGRRRYRGGYRGYGGYTRGGSSFWPFLLGSLWGSSQNRSRMNRDNFPQNKHNQDSWFDDKPRGKGVGRKKDDDDWFGGGGFGGFGGFGGGGGFSGGGGGTRGNGAGRF